MPRQLGGAACVVARSRKSHGGESSRLALLRRAGQFKLLRRSNCPSPGSAPVVAEEGVIFAGRQQEQQRRPRLSTRPQREEAVSSSESHGTVLLGREASDSASDNEDSGDESFRAAEWASSDS